MCVSSEVLIPIPSYLEKSCLVGTQLDACNSTSLLLIELNEEVMAAPNNSGKPRCLDLRLNYIPVACSDASVQVALYEEGVYPQHSTL